MASALALSVVTGARCAAGFVSTQPTVRVEYWQKRLVQIATDLNGSKDLSSFRLVFLGDSITDFWLMGDNPWMTGAKMGRKIWDESFNGWPQRNLALNLGVSGDRTEHILYRLLPKSAGGLGELDEPGLQPEFVILLAGINNTWDPEKPVVDSVFDGIRAVIMAVHERKPQARIILQSLLPTNDAAKNRDVVVFVNLRLRQLASSLEFSGYVSYLELYPFFVDAAGNQIAGDFCDGLHPNEAGFRIWRDRLVPFLDEVRSAEGVKRSPK